MNEFVIMIMIMMRSMQLIDGRSKDADELLGW